MSPMKALVYPPFLNNKNYPTLIPGVYIVSLGESLSSAWNDSKATLLEPAQAQPEFVINCRWLLSN